MQKRDIHFGLVRKDLKWLHMGAKEWD